MTGFPKMKDIPPPPFRHYLHEEFCTEGQGLKLWRIGIDEQPRYFSGEGEPDLVSDIPETFCRPIGRFNIDELKAMMPGSYWHVKEVKIENDAPKFIAVCNRPDANFQIKKSGVAPGIAVAEVIIAAIEQKIITIEQCNAAVKRLNIAPPLPPPATVDEEEDKYCEREDFLFRAFIYTGFCGCLLWVIIHSIKHA